MAEKEELLAEAEALGVKVHGNASTATIRRKIEAARSEPDESKDESTDEVPASPPETDDGWPQRIAPLAWLDQKGRRYTDLGEAIAGAEECRNSP